MIWKPDVTVASVVERDDGRFLLVEEAVDGRLVINQPAGHLEAGETLADAACREALEETAWTIELTGVVALSLYRAPANGVTYHRTTFCARPRSHDATLELDKGIIRAVWLSYEQMCARSDKMRSPMVIRVVERYLAGHHFPLNLID